MLHNWNDEDACTILRNVRAAMEPGHRLLVADFVGGPDAVTTLIPFMDIAGMLIYSGRERTEKEMALLFEATGFRFRRLIPLPLVRPFSKESPSHKSRRLPFGAVK